MLKIKPLNQEQEKAALARISILRNSPRIFVQCTSPPPPKELAKVIERAFYKSAIEHSALRASVLKGLCSESVVGELWIWIAEFEDPHVCEAFTKYWKSAPPEN